MPLLSAPENVLFLVLLAASAYGFWLRFGEVRPQDPRGQAGRRISHSHPLGKRIWDFVWEVLLQGKVIRSGLCPASRTPSYSGDSAPSRWSR